MMQRIQRVLASVAGLIALGLQARAAGRLPDADRTRVQARIRAGERPR